MKDKPIPQDHETFQEYLEAWTKWAEQHSISTLELFDHSFIKATLALNWVQQKPNKP